MPRLRGWRPPALPFSLRTVLRREYPTWSAAILSLAAIDIAADFFENDFNYDWIAIVVLGLGGYLILHTLDRRTRLLRVAGR